MEKYNLFPSTLLTPYLPLVLSPSRPLSLSPSLPLSLSSSLPQLFVAQGKEILVSGDDCVEEGVLGQGAYATVFQVRIRKNGEVRM